MAENNRRGEKQKRGAGRFGNRDMDHREIIHVNGIVAVIYDDARDRNDGFNTQKECATNRSIGYTGD